MTLLPYKILFGPKTFITALSTKAILGKLKKANVKAKADVAVTKVAFDSSRFNKFEKDVATTEGVTTLEETECPITIIAIIAVPPRKHADAIIRPCNFGFLSTIYVHRGQEKV